MHDNTDRYDGSRNLEEGVVHLNEAEYLGPNEEIWQGDLRLQELMNKRVWLREKSALLEVEAKKLEDEIKKDFLDKEPRMTKQGVHDHLEELGDYCQELISLMPWVGPHITNRINHGGAMLMIKCETQPVIMKYGYVPGKLMDDQMKPYTGGAVT